VLVKEYCKLVNIFSCYDKN